MSTSPEIKDSTQAWFTRDYENERECLGTLENYICSTSVLGQFLIYLWPSIASLILVEKLGEYASESPTHANVEKPGFSELFSSPFQPMDVNSWT